MLSFDSIHFAYHQEPVLSDVSFSAAPGEITCVVGPSGCGKSTLLALAAGLLEVQTGEIRLDDELLARPGFNLPPERRPVGLVFQEGALFPHMTVAENVGFGVSGAQRSARVARLLALVGLEGEASRYPHTLSGGQRQRVALARALAPAPRALLFDEPYANLDQGLRQALRFEAREMVRRSGTVGLFVTHDPEDVMALADQVVVLQAGHVLQAGTPRQLFEAPVGEAVARLFGQAQCIPATVSDGLVRSEFGEWPVAELLASKSQIPAETAVETASHKEGPVTLCLRADAIALEPAASGPLLAELRLAGADDLAELENDRGGRLFARLSRPHGFARGDRVRLMPTPGGVFLFPRKLVNEKDSH